ncbi:metal-dependent hydrolase [Burkholderia guangdongensis]|uniref:metal-dependent hydrolase n=1 Tax=Burkholderia guangdongensis TaxID=1792500 RepID=UPI0015C873F9|nr:metal-dependent hydrolase [Burkholderia guangdongensis]
MASHHAHHATGFAAGLIAAVLVAQSGAAGPWHVGCAAAFVAGVAGGTAPDWLEVAWWSRARRLWITHRTVTHWGIGWIAMLAFAWHALAHRPSPLWAAPLLGFACGGIMHLLADWPNPLGVPWIWRRHSLKLWKSGHCDLIVVATAWAGALWFAHAAWGHMLPFRYWLGWLANA